MSSGPAYQQLQLLQALSQLPTVAKLQAVRQMYRQALTEPEHVGLVSTLVSLAAQLQAL